MFPNLLKRVGAETRRGTAEFSSDQPAITADPSVVALFQM